MGHRVDGWREVTLLCATTVRNRDSRETRQASPVNYFFRENFSSAWKSEKTSGSSTSPFPVRSKSATEASSRVD